MNKPCPEIYELEPVEGVDDPGFGAATAVATRSLVDYVGIGDLEEGTLGVGNHPISVAPEEMGVGTTNEVFGVFNLPVMQHLNRSKSAPKFSNKKEDWLDFVWNFESWVRVISAGKKLSDGEMLQLFNTCLPENLQKELNLLEKKEG